MIKNNHNLEIWAENFYLVPKRSTDINDEAVSLLPRINSNLDNVPTEDEIRKALRQLS